MMEGPGANSEEKREPVSDIDIAVADSLKVLDLKRPIREATFFLSIPRQESEFSEAISSVIRHSGRRSVSVILTSQITRRC
jgi:hypothetical protein